MESLVLNLEIENLSESFVNFYHGVIQTLNTSNDILANQSTLSTLRHTYSRKLRSNNPCSVCFDSVDVRCAYIFQFCPSFSLAIASHFLLLLKGISQQQLQRLVLEDTLVICCLGGGPATDIVAICKVLLEVRRIFATSVTKPLMVDATVIDSENGWSTTAELVVNSLPNLVDESVVKINQFRFIKHDFTETMSEDVATVLGQSHVISMNKFLSALHGRNYSADSRHIMKDTVEHIPKGSILFLMDSSGWPLFDEMVRIVGSLVQEGPIYGPVRRETSHLSGSSQMLCSSINSGIYGQQCCTAQTSNNAVAWLKNTSSSKRS